jgi:hypothetical protein
MILPVSLDAPADADKQPPRFTRLLIALADEIYTGIRLEKRKEVASSQSIRDGSWKLRSTQTNRYTLPEVRQLKPSVECTLLPILQFKPRDP